MEADEKYTNSSEAGMENTKSNQMQEILVHKFIQCNELKWTEELDLSDEKE